MIGVPSGACSLLGETPSLLAGGVLQQEELGGDSGSGGGSDELMERGGLPDAAVLERSEFLLPLDPGTAALYRRLLQR